MGFLSSVNEYVIGFAMSKDKKHIKLIKKQKPSTEFGKCNGIGGQIDGFALEQPLDTMLREFYEQTKIITYPHEWFYFGLLTGSKFNIYMFCRFNDDILTFCNDDEEIVYAIDDIIDNQKGLFYLSWVLNVCRDTEIKRMFLTMKYS